MPLLTGTVLAVEPKGLYSVAIEGGRRVSAHLAPGTKRNFVRLVVGDKVEVSLSPRDLGRGRVTRRLK